MEALLKLIVGVDGVTAGMLTQVAYLYVVGLSVTAVKWIAIFLGMTAIICKTVKYGIDKCN